MQSNSPFHQTTGFDWDKANLDKNWLRHRVSFFECEQVFFLQPIVLPDTQHSNTEMRYFALGATFKERLLTLVFTIRDNKIRIISARSMSRKERLAYEKIKETL